MRPTESTEYRINITDNNECEYIDTVAISVIPAVTLGFDLIIEPGCDNNTLVRVINLSEGTDEFLWDFGNGETSEAFEPTIQYTDTGTYQISLRTPGNNNGCSPPVARTIDLQETFVPNVFTPNEDEWNQFFEVRTSHPIDLKVLNRMGEAGVRTGRLSK